MKKIYFILIAAILISRSALATIHMITVSSFQFTPNNLTVDVGDTLMWMWSDGSHTTTSSSIPAGADPWNAPMNSTNTDFTYVVTVEGTYNYVCTPHAGFMRGQFTAVSTSSVRSITAADGFFINPTNNGSTLNIGYTVNRSSTVKVSLIDLTGKVAKVLVNNLQPAGRYTESYSADELQKGIYIAEMITGSERYTKRIIIQ